MRWPDEKQATKVLLGLFLAGLACYFFAYVYFAVIAIAYPYQLDYGEGFYLDRAWLLSHGQDAYHDITSYPVVVATHPPVYPLFCAPLVKLFGVSFATGRVVSLISALLIGLLIYVVVQKKTQSKLIGGIASLLFFASPFVFEWTVLYRPDTLGLLFSLAGVYLVFRYESSRRVYLAIPFFLLAVYTRQTLVAAPIASCIYLFTRDRRLAITTFLIFVALAGSAFVAANYLTDGQFYLHTVRYNVQSFPFAKVLDDYTDMVRIHLVPMVFALYLSIRMVLKREPSLFVIYFVASAVVALSIGKVGATINYALEPVIAACLLMGISLNRSRLQSMFIVVMLLLQLLALYHIPMDYLPYAAGTTEGVVSTPQEADLKYSQEVSLYVRSVEGKVLSDDAGLVVLNGKELLIDLFMATQLCRQGMWDQTSFVRDLEEREFSLIILKQNLAYQTYDERLTAEMVKAIRDSYQMVHQIGENYLYEPV